MYNNNLSNFENDRTSPGNDFFERVQEDLPTDVEKLFANLLIVSDFKIPEIEQLAQYELSEKEEKKIGELVEKSEKVRKLLEQVGTSHNMSTIFKL